jgi:hypothetical protein
MPEDNNGQGRSLSEVASRAASRASETTDSLGSRSMLTYPNRYAREFARVGSGYRSSPNRHLLRGSARKGYRG